MIDILREPPMQASKWLQVQALLDFSEMQKLLLAIAPFHMFLSGSICQVGEGEISADAFLETYGKYIAALKGGVMPDESLIREHFSSALTCDEGACYGFPLPDGRMIVRVREPVVQLQVHRMSYSEADGNFYPMVLGSGSIYWGIQFSYPQLYQDPASREPVMVAKDPRYVNTALFRKIQKWIRENTIPTPFLVEGKTTNVPMRIGKACLTWINKHPQLVMKGIRVNTEMKGRG